MRDIKTILSESKTIVVFGLSAKTERASHTVAQYLLRAGYTIIPVNPGQTEILGQKCYKSLEEIPGDIQVDIVDVFRKSEDTPPIAKAAVAIGAKCLWLQLGIENKESLAIARDAGLDYVEDKCIKIEHSNANL
ncbi:MAG: CoA-binding protein [Spirochaetota bacterium]